MPSSSDAAAVAADSAGGELPAQLALLECRRIQARTQRWIGRRRHAPSLDTAGRLQPGDGGDRVRAGEVVRRGKRLGVGSRVRILLGHGRLPVGTAEHHSPEGAHRPSQLPLYGLPIAITRLRHARLLVPYARRRSP